MRTLVCPATVAALIVAGCATKPQHIPSANVSPVQLKDFPCNELRFELGIAQEQRDAYVKRQSGNRTRDTLLNVLVLPGLGAATGDHETEVAQSKGRVVAIEREIATRCRE